MHVFLFVNFLLFKSEDSNALPRKPKKKNARKADISRLASTSFSMDSAFADAKKWTLTSDDFVYVSCDKKKKEVTLCISETYTITIRTVKKFMKTCYVSTT